MIAPKIVAAFGLLAVCILMSLSALGVITLDVANDSLKRILLVIGAIGGTFTLIYILFSIGKSKPSPGQSSVSDIKNTGPKF